MPRNITLVGKTVSMKEYDQQDSDLEYWLSKTPQERLQAVTFLIRQNLAKGQRMDKTIHSKKMMK